MTNKALLSIEEINKMMMEQASQAAKAEKSDVKYISLKGKRFTLGETRLGDEINVVIAATSFENAYYDSDYDPDHPQPPACFAVSIDGKEMEPHSDAPNPQNDTCEGCPMNEWGSGRGKGKACKNGRRMAVFAYSDDGTISEEYALIRIAPTSLKKLSSYIKVVSARFKKPLYGVVTKLSFDDKYDYSVLNFEMVDHVEDVSILQDMITNQETYQELVLEPYGVEGYEKKDIIATDAPKKKSKMS